MNDDKRHTQVEYKIGDSYIGVLQEAKALVKGVEEKKAIRKAAFEKAGAAVHEEAPPEPTPSWTERNLPAIVSFAKQPACMICLRWLVRVALLCAIVWQGDRLRAELMSEELSPPMPGDVLIDIEANAPDFDGVRNYAQYIVNKVGAGGMEAIAGKWIDGIDPAFKDQAKPLLAELAAGFKLGRVSADKAIVYNVECHPDLKPGRTVTLEIVKGRLGSGRAVYRLQKIY